MPKASRGGRITVLSARDQCSETKPRLLAKIGLHPQLKRDSGRGAAASIIVRMSLDFTECDRARLARDPVYDGQFYTGVHTTGIYCRPVCPVRPARSAERRSDEAPCTRHAPAR